MDWAQSSLTNFSPMVVRDFQQPSTSRRRHRRRRSLSTRCGIDHAAIAGRADRGHIARSIGTIGMSAVFFQDMFGLITFEDEVRAARRRPPAHRQEPGDPLPRRLSVRDTGCRRLRRPDR